MLHGDTVHTGTTECSSRLPAAGNEARGRTARSGTLDRATCRAGSAGPALPRATRVPLRRGRLRSAQWQVGVAQRWDMKDGTKEASQGLGSGRRLVGLDRGL